MFLLSSYLSYKGVDDVTVFKGEIIRCLLFIEPFALVEEPHRGWVDP